MKIRTDFVTNSSSSSFICEYCGNVEGGYDMTLSEANMVQCEKDHTLCEYHVRDTVNFEMKKNMLISALEEEFIQTSNYSEDRMLAKLVELTHDIEFAKNLTEDLYKKDYNYEMEFDDLLDYYDILSRVPSSICPLCTHEVVSNNEIIEFCARQFGISISQLKELTRQFLIERDKSKE